VIAKRRRSARIRIALTLARPERTLAGDSRKPRYWAEIEPHQELVKCWLGTVTIATIHHPPSTSAFATTTARARRSRSGATSRRTSTRKWPARRSGCCATLRRLEMKPKSTTGCSGGGSTRPPGACVGGEASSFVLAFSCLMFPRSVLMMDEQSCVESHVLAFEFLVAPPRGAGPCSPSPGRAVPSASLARFRTPVSLSQQTSEGA